MSRFLFGLGEMVTWQTTQGRQLTGTVIKVLAPYKLPGKQFPRLGIRVKMGRDHESYVVEVEIDGQKKHFWPRVGDLRAAV